MTKTNGISLAAIASQVTKDDTVEFEPRLPSGDLSGIVLLIKSDESPSVRPVLNSIQNERRKMEAMIEAKAAKAPAGEVIVTVEQDQAFVWRAAAARVFGWKGIDDEFSKDNAVQLFSLIPSWATQVIAKAGELAGFTKASPTA